VGSLRLFKSPTGYLLIAYGVAVGAFMWFDVVPQWSNLAASLIGMIIVGTMAAALAGSALALTGFASGLVVVRPDTVQVWNGLRRYVVGRTEVVAVVVPDAAPRYSWLPQVATLRCRDGAIIPMLGVYTSERYAAPLPAALAEHLGVRLTRGDTRGRSLASAPLPSPDREHWVAGPQSAGPSEPIAPMTRPPRTVRTEPLRAAPATAPAERPHASLSTDGGPRTPWVPPSVR